MVSNSELMNFVDSNRQPYPLVGVIRVGSTARGYALTGSDIDMMAFYEAGHAFESHPFHSTYAGTRVTLEHHDLQTFMASASDFRFSLASIRQLHKVRDGVPLVGEDDLSALLTLARGAHLDRSVVLQSLAKIARYWPTIWELSPAARTHQIISWTEWLGTLQAVSKPGREAYSKPKWLFRTLHGAGVGAAADLLNVLDPPTTERVESVAAALETIEAGFHPERHGETFRLLLKTGLNDAREMIEHDRSNSLPAARFIAAQYHRAERGFPPVQALRQAGACEGCGYDVIFTDPQGGTGPAEELIVQFLAFGRGLADELRIESRMSIGSRIGTVRFFNHMLDTYEAADVLPNNSLDRVAAALLEIEAVFVPEGVGRGVHP